MTTFAPAKPGDQGAEDREKPEGEEEEQQEPVPDSMELPLAGWSLPDLTHMAEAGEKMLKETGEKLTEALEAFARNTQRSRFATEAEFLAQQRLHAPSVKQARENAAQAALSVDRQCRQVEELVSLEIPPTLPAKEMERANMLAPFAREDAQLPYPDLIRRLAAVLLTEDTVQIFLLARYVKARIAAEDRQQSASFDGGRGGVQWFREKAEAVRLVDLLDKRLPRDTSLDKIRERVKAVRAKAQALTEASYDMEEFRARAMREAANRW